MKVLFDHPNPFVLAHGGFQTQIEQTKAGLESVGIEVDYLRWWDDQQRGDIIHYFGRCPVGYIRFAHQKKIKLVMEQLLTGLGSRSTWARFFQKVFIKGLQANAPAMITSPFNWEAFRLADACIANTPWEAHLMSEMFQANQERVHVLPNGVESVFFNSVAEERGKWLVCTATITERKRVLELGQAAIIARTPLWVVGKAYSESDPYAKRFFELARANPKLIRYEGAIQDRKKLAGIYRQARGFVLLSTMETRSLSAEEAAACECPLLLSDLPWAKSVFKEKVTYCKIISPVKTAMVLKEFYSNAPLLPTPQKPMSWSHVGKQLKSIYEEVLKTSR